MKKYYYLSSLSDEERKLAEKDCKAWIEIFRIGKWKHPQYGWIVATREMFESFIRNWKNKVIGRELSFDFHHRPEWGAAAWVKDMKIEGDRLKAYVEFTPRGCEAVKNKEFIYFSPEYVDDYVDKENPSIHYGPTLLGGGLTNTPFLTNLAPIVLSECVENQMYEFQACVGPECEKALISAQTANIHTPQYLPNLEIDYSDPTSIETAWESLERQYKSETDEKKRKELLKLAREVFDKAQSMGVKLKGRLAQAIAKVSKLQDILKHLPPFIESRAVISLIGSHTKGDLSSDLDLHCRWEFLRKRFEEAICKSLPVEMGPVHFVDEKMLGFEEPFTQGIPLYHVQLVRCDPVDWASERRLIPLPHDKVLRFELEFRAGKLLDDKGFKGLKRLEGVLEDGKVKAFWSAETGFVFYEVQKLDGKRLMEVADVQSRYLEEMADAHPLVNQAKFYSISQAKELWNKGYDWVLVWPDDEIESVHKFLFHPENYNPAKVRDDQLRDDLRIAIAHLSNLDKGRKSMFKSREEGISFLEKIVDELLKRKAITFHPEEWSKAAEKYLKPILQKRGFKFEDNPKQLSQFPSNFKVDLGCGPNKAEGYFGIDKVYYPGVDLVYDCNQGIPLPDNCADEVRAIHSLEHFDDQTAIMWEIWRILKPGGRLVFEVPSTKGEGAYIPDHRNFWNKTVVMFYTQPHLAQGRPLFELEELEEQVKGDYCYLKGVMKAVKGSTSGTRRCIDSPQSCKLYEPIQKGMQLPKPQMKVYTEFFNVDELWDNWAKKRIEAGHKIAVENKLNGFRCFIQKKGNRISCFFEDSQKERDFPDLIEPLKKIPDDFALDTNVGINEKGKPLPRIMLMKLIGGNPKLEEGEVLVATIFDLPYWKEDLTSQPLGIRRKRLEEFYNRYLKGNPHFELSQQMIVDSKPELERAFKKLGFLPMSEGIVAKNLDSGYQFGPMAEWAKIKHMVEFKAMVYKVQRNANGTYSFWCGLLKGDSPYVNTIEFQGQELVDMGKTYNAKFRAEPGDIITVEVEELIPKDTPKGPVLDWLGALPVDIDKERTKPYFANQCVDLAKRGHIWQGKET
ncbi:MAG TPA: methyltransferase domain-containing protein [Thermococcus sp.]|nr:methyltransferase domain-containing protein [Thermococcus sp.]